MNQLRVGAVLAYANLAASNVLALLVTPLMLRSLGQSEFGLYSLVGAFVAYISVLDFGLNNAVIRYVSKFRAEHNPAAESAFVARCVELYWAIAALSVLVGAVVIANLGSMFGATLTPAELGEGRRLFAVMVFNLAISFPLGAYQGVVNAYEQFVFLRGVNLLRSLVRTIVLVALLLLGRKAMAIVLLDTALNIGVGLLNVYYVRSRIGIKPSRRAYAFEPGFFRGLTTYTAFVFISIIVDQLYWKIGHFVVGALVGTEAVAVFAIAIQFTTYYMQFPMAIGGMFLPRVTALVVAGASADELLEIFVRTSRVQLLILGYVLGGFFLCGRDFIVLWAGREYGGAWLIALVMMLPLTVPLCQTIGLHILQAKNMHRFRAISYLCIALLNVGASIPMVRHWGALGAAFATASSLTLGNIVANNWYYHYRVGLDIKRFVRGLTRGILPAMVAAVVLGALGLAVVPGHSWAALVLRVAIYSGAYGAVMWRFGMNDYERDLARSAISWLRTGGTREAGAGQRVLRAPQQRR